jgi:uncharacterized protein
MHTLKLSENAVGLGVKSVYYDSLMETTHKIDFCEAHIENFIAGGLHLNQLKKIAENMPISLHGVALSLGGQLPPSTQALEARKRIIDMINPVFVSEHAACTFAGQHLNDLLPISLNHKTITRLVHHIDIVQSYFKRQILLENLSSYIVFDDDEMCEYDFLNNIAQQSGCGLLVDINNIDIQEQNLNRSATDFIENINPDYVKQYHLAGGEYSVKHDKVIDTHGTDITPHVMALYDRALDKIGFRPTLYERDNNIPPFDALLHTVQDIRQTHKKMVKALC